MQVKVFEAVDMPTGLKMVKEDLGPDALILSTRTIRNGKLGMLGKPTLEITAAIDSPWPEEKNSGGPALSPPLAGAVRKDVQPDETLTYQDIWAKTAAEETSSANGYRHEQTTEQATRNEDPDKLSREIQELKQIIDNLSQRMVNHDVPPIVHSRTTRPAMDRLHGDSDPVAQLLLSRGLSPQVAGLVARFVGDLTGQSGRTRETPQQALCAALAKLFTVRHPLAKRPRQQKRISLIGPTGAGKTTTIAKLAAGYLGRFGGRVALLTIDTYRIAAVEQLKVYGEIMGLPVEVIIKPSDMPQALARHGDCDLILIDTAGRSPANGLEIAEMGAFLAPEFAIENHLVLPATNRENELETIVGQFSRLPVDSIIFSKVDECSLLGVLLNLHYSLDMPISYLTNGQRVPEDILVATPDLLARSIMNPSAVKNND